MGVPVDALCRRAPRPTDVLDVEIAIPTGRLHVSAAEVFDAEEAADLFETYRRSGDIPADYASRPVEGYRADGSALEIP
jgi:hypothetical protein